MEIGFREEKENFFIMARSFIRLSLLSFYQKMRLAHIKNYIHILVNLRPIVRSCPPYCHTLPLSSGKLFGFTVKQMFYA